MTSWLRIAFISLCAILLIGIAAMAAMDPYAPLLLYGGTWRELPNGKQPFQLTNVCNRIGEYFACQQTMGGKVASLIIFIPAKETGHYYTQVVLPEGWATGRGEIQIAGRRWTYLSKVQDGAKTTYYRTTNLFTGKDRIYYETFESSDGKEWKRTGWGNEVRSVK